MLYFFPNVQTCACLMTAHCLTSLPMMMVSVNNLLCYSYMLYNSSLNVGYMKASFCHRFRVRPHVPDAAGLQRFPAHCHPLTLSRSKTCRLQVQPGIRAFTRPKHAMERIQSRSAISETEEASLCLQQQVKVKLWVIS